MSRRIYLDHSATTPVDPRVAAAMAFLVGYCGSGSKLWSVVVRLPTVVSSVDRER